MLKKEKLLPLNVSFVSLQFVHNLMKTNYFLGADYLCYNICVLHIRCYFTYLLLAYTETVY